MARSYPYLSAIKDPDIRGALRALFDQIGALQEGNQAQKGPPDMGGNRVRRVAAPEAEDDAVPLSYLTKQLQALKEEIRRRGADNLTGQLAEPQIPRIVDVDPAGPLPDKTIAKPNMLVRYGPGVLKFFDPRTNNWEDV